MSLIGNLQDEAELFSASSRFQSVASGLKRIIDGQQIEGIETENFEWVGDLAGQMDWNSEHYKRGEHKQLCVIATRLRPKFYGALVRFRIPFDTKFSDKLYETLKSCGRIVQLGMEELRQAHQLYQEMATGILTDLQYAHHIGQI